MKAHELRKISEENTGYDQLMKDLEMNAKMGSKYYLVQVNMCPLSLELTKKLIQDGFTISEYTDQFFGQNGIKIQWA